MTQTRSLALGCVLVLGAPLAVHCANPGLTVPAGSHAKPARHAGPGLRLHIEGSAGTPLISNGGDQRINPASLVKVATTLWALERLGPEHRFSTRIGTDGAFDPETGRVEGNLVVLGSGDPDFHIENAYWVLRELFAKGLREVSGDLLVSPEFWIGWEGGSEKREMDPQRRAEQMARRLWQMIDPAQWTAATRQAIGELQGRRPELEGKHPRIVVHGQPGVVRGQPVRWRGWVTHRSNPLVQTLRRFNQFSNNDIERLELSLGSAARLSSWLSERWDVEAGQIEFSSLSGLGRNRITPRLVVRLMADLRDTAKRRQLQLADLLPVTGCGLGTLHNYPRLTNEAAGALVGKTGTLRETDGGVAVLAGIVETARGQQLFCVVSPNSGRRLDPARAEQEAWLLDWIADHGGPSPQSCGPELPFSDTAAEVAIGLP